MHILYRFKKNGEHCFFALFLFLFYRWFLPYTFLFWLLLLLLYKHFSPSLSRFSFLLTCACLCSLRTNYLFVAIQLIYTYIRKSMLKIFVLEPFVVRVVWFRRTIKKTWKKEQNNQNGKVALWMCKEIVVAFFIAGNFHNSEAVNIKQHMGSSSSSSANTINSSNKQTNRGKKMEIIVAYNCRDSRVLCVWMCFVHILSIF